MKRRIGEREINNIGELFKIWDNRGNVTVDDHARLNLEDVSIAVNEEWDKLFAKDTPDSFKLQVCDDMCYSQFGQQELPCYSEYMELVDKYNKVKESGDSEEEFKYYHYLLAIMWEAIAVICG